MKHKDPHKLKSTALLVFCMLFSLSAFSQHFDWVKTYTGLSFHDDEYNRIISSVTDQNGNLYVLGYFTPNARINSTNLLPFVVTDENDVQIGVLVAKFTPSGDIAWHKAIYSFNSSSLANDIRYSGDNSITVMVTFELPYSGSHYDYNPVYYLDTLLTTVGGGLMVTDSLANMMTTAFITFDYDGNVMEQHFVQLAHVDTTGATIRMDNIMGTSGDNRIVTGGLSSEMFNIDKEGNIYVCRKAIDYHNCYTPHGIEELSIENGRIGQQRILVDGQYSLYCTPSYRSDHRNQQILKFSPHFEQLIDAIYVFDSLNIPDGLYTDIGVTAFEKDDEDNLYLSLGGNNYPDTMLISNSDSLLCLSSDMVAFDACMIGYTSDLVATRVVQLSCTPDPMNIQKSYYFHGTTYDNETNTLYILGSVQKDPLTITNPDCWITYNDDTLDLNRNLFWLRLDPSDNSLVSYGKARSSAATKIKLTDGGLQQASLAVKGNRVFSQVGYQGDICFKDSTIDLGGAAQHGIGLMCWDADGHEIEYIDFNAIGSRNKTGRVHIVDSILYMNGIVNSSADFGQHHINSVNHDQAYLAKYVDPSFMTPYVYTDPRVEQAIEWSQGLSFSLTDSPVTLTATATSGLPVTYLCADTSVARIAGNTLHLLSNGTTTVTAYQNGNEYGYYPATPVTKTLTVGNVSISTVEAEPQVKAYPNPTSGQVTIDLTSLPPIQPVVRDSSDIQVTLSDEAGAFVKYGNPFRQRAIIKSNENITTAYLTDMQGRREEITLIPAGNGKYTLDLTSRPQATYLLTLTTATGKTHTLRLLKQSELFGK